MLNQEQLAHQLAVKMMLWDKAKEMVEPIVLEHGLEPYSVGGNIFTPGSEITPVDQNISSIIEVAGWLLEPLT